MLALDTDFDGCMKIVQEVTRDNSIYLANSMNSLRVEGQKTVGIEIVQQLGWNVPDWIVLPSGNLGNISALAKGLALAKDAGRHRPAAAAGRGAGRNAPTRSTRPTGAGSTGWRRSPRARRPPPPSASAIP